MASAPKWDETEDVVVEQSAAPSWDDTEETLDVSQVESGLRGTAQGFSMGFADEITGALESTFTDKTYQQARDESRAAYKSAQESNPNTYLAGEFAGGVGTLAIPGLNAVKGAKLAAVAGKAALQGGLTGLGMSEGENPGEIARDAAIGTAMGAGAGVVGEKIIGPALRKGGQLVKEGLEAIAPKVDSGTDWLLKKTGQVVAGVPEEYTDEYITRKGQISARPSEVIADELVGHNQAASEALDAAKEKLAASKQALRDTEFSLKEGIKDSRFSTREQFSDARNALDSRYKEEIEGLKGFNLNDLAEDIDQSLVDLKDRVSRGSSRAFDVLEKDKDAIYRLDPVRRALDEGMSSMMVSGQPISDSAVSSVQKLQTLKERITALGNEITGPQAKQILQQLDNDLKATYNAGQGAYTPEADAIKKQIRGILDMDLKSTNPEYANAMKEVAADARALNLANAAFGKRDRALNRLKGLSSNRGRELDAQILKDLGRRTGRNFDESVAQYLDTQELLKSPTRMSQLKESLPEYAEFMRLQEQVNDLRDPALMRSLDQEAGMLEALKGVEGGESGLVSAKERFDALKGLNEGQIQNKMKSLTGARDYAPTKVFEDVDRITGKPYTKEIKDRAILDSFEKGDTNGSRKTVLGSVLGGAVGSMAGFGPGTVAGTAIGGAAGAAADKYAGKVVKKALDTKIIAADKLGEILKAAPQRFGKYAKPLQNAAARGGTSLAATHFVLQQSDPEYRKMFDPNGSENE